MQGINTKSLECGCWVKTADRKHQNLWMDHVITLQTTKTAITCP